MAQERLTGRMAALAAELPVRFFVLAELAEAISWAEQGHVAVHENFSTSSRASLHVISANQGHLLHFCRLCALDPAIIRSAEAFRFWHLDWIP
ncbi:MAG: hypothetical protein AB1634_05980 [Thermodesulfobacteriota bacterium]